jgi:hypothetical protein
MVFRFANPVKIIININNVVIFVIRLHMRKIKFDKEINYNCRVK